MNLNRYPFIFQQSELKSPLSKDDEVCQLAFGFNSPTPGWTINRLSHSIRVDMEYNNTCLSPLWSLGDSEKRLTLKWNEIDPCSISIDTQTHTNPNLISSLITNQIVLSILCVSSTLTVVHWPRQRWIDTFRRKLGIVSSSAINQLKEMVENLIKLRTC